MKTDGVSFTYLGWLEVEAELRMDGKFQGRDEWQVYELSTYIMRNGERVDVEVESLYERRFATLPVKFDRLDDILSEMALEKR